MKKIIFPLVVLALTCGVTRGQEEPATVSEHLKCYGPFIGNWQYEGPMQEDFEGIAEEGTIIVVRTSMKRILNGSAIEGNWSIEFQGGAKLMGKDLTGWDAKQEKIVHGAMSSGGTISGGSITHDKATKSLTFSLKGVDGDGEETSSKVVLTKIDKDTYTWQATERTGGPSDGPSGVYTFKRVKRQAKKEAK
ncbi:DUF1579 family protein [Novipirellula artificiosorum]|uniref:Lipocalin-like domain-containing protein n=1 Tax=Novipirellula artificiosorum TaxID=2528016 RepID=A0A5C6DDQ2_9BACT|nr:DUF1579 family protein [Novipirellula artificiosorum]TWU34838.1 hypothetical protein Poly41_39810 [Novipirellula artificiosorum]